MAAWNHWRSGQGPLRATALGSGVCVWARACAGCSTGHLLTPIILCLGLTLIILCLGLALINLCLGHRRQGTEPPCHTPASGRGSNSRICLPFHLDKAQVRHPASWLPVARCVCLCVCVWGGVACAYACCVSSYYINPSSTAWQLCYDAVDIRCDLMRSSCVYGVSVQSDDTARARGGASDPTRHDGDPKRHARKHAAPTPHSTSPHRRFFSPARSGRDFLSKPHSRTVDT